MVIAPEPDKPWVAGDAPGAADVVYPDSDGEPMADNTRQYEWIVLLRENLNAMLEDFVAGDLLWYPVKGRPKIRTAPDVLVALGRPKGHRGSYKQFEEDDVPPAVVFEVLSPRDTIREMARKGVFYAHYGAREMIVIDPEDETGWAMVWDESGDFEEIPTLDGWTSPTLGVRFAREGDRLAVYRPDEARFLSFEELGALRGEAEQRAEREAARAEREAARAEREAARAERLAAQLAALGIDPESP